MAIYWRGHYVVGIAISVGFSPKQRNRKELTYDFEGMPLVSVKSNAKDKIKCCIISIV